MLKSAEEPVPEHDLAGANDELPQVGRIGEAAIEVGVAARERGAATTTTASEKAGCDDRWMAHIEGEGKLRTRRDSQRTAQEQSKQRESGGIRGAKQRRGDHAHSSRRPRLRTSFAPRMMKYAATYTSSPAACKAHSEAHREECKTRSCTTAFTMAEPCALTTDSANRKNATGARSRASCHRAGLKEKGARSVHAE